MKSIRYIMYFVLMSMTMSLLAQENAQAVAQGENKIDEKTKEIVTYPYIAVKTKEIGKPVQFHN